jgi:N6-L-threonylcarbamoyladenine synthase
MRILGIETSCDETAAAVVEDGVKIVFSVVASSAEMHIKTGGIIPEKAAREQLKSIIPVIDEALKESPIKTIDAIGVTVGPGLIGSLLVGIEAAKTLAYAFQKPIIPVNHLVAHIYANFLSDTPPQFPCLCLVVSGGHSDIVLMKGHGDLEWIGGTRDDAAGEAFDKTARLLGLPYPGGPAIGLGAKTFMDKNPDFKLTLFPRPMITDDNFDFSFSGLKTAVLRYTENNKDTDINQLCAEVQQAIVDVLIAKTFKAINKYKPQSLLLAGGVAANLHLRESFAKKAKELDLGFYCPPLPLCTDNAATIASCTFFNQKTFSLKDIEANPELTINDAF